MNELTQTTPEISAPETVAAAPSDLSYLIRAEDDALSAFIRDAGLYMNAGQLRLCLMQLQKAHEAPSMDAIRLLDALCEQYSKRAETQTLMGLDTNDPNHADALSALICNCRDAAARRTTPPMQLRTVLQAIHRDVNTSQPTSTYDRDASLRFTLCDAITAATLSAAGNLPTASVHIAGSSLQLISHQPPVERKRTRRLSNDRLCFVYTDAQTPTFAQSRAAAALFDAALEQHLIHTVLPVSPHMLLPVALSCVGRGLTIDASTLPVAAADALPQPADIVTAAPGGWLLSVASDKLETLQALSASFPLTVVPFAVTRKDPMVEFAVVRADKPVRIPTDLLRSMEFSLSYRLTDDCPTDEVCIPSPIPLTPLLLQDAYPHLSDELGCGDWALRTLTLPLDDTYRPDAFPRAIAALQEALHEDGCTDLRDATLACGLEISATLPHQLLWQNVLQLYHTLHTSPLPLLPIALQHVEGESSQCVLCMICHKPQPDLQSAPHDTSPTTPQRTLPLPADCSLVHAEQPEVLIVHTAATSIAPIAATLQAAGGTVRTLRPDGSESGATVLADAIHAARLVLFVDADEHLEQALAHRRVQYALVSLVERDGLCLAQGDAVCPVCRTGLFDAILPELPVCAPVDAFAAAFPVAVGYVRDLDRPDDEPVLRPLPQRLLLLREDIPVGDPMVELFRSHEASERNILAVTATEDGTPAAVRLSAAGGHLIAFADGFTPTQLQEAVQYFR